MSVSLLLLPVALPALAVMGTMRAALGKEGYERWLATLEVRTPTRITSRRELERILRRAGLDAIQYGDVIKTHFDRGRAFLFWRLIDGSWTAVFAKTESRKSINRFMDELEQSAGRPVFEREEQQPLRQSSHQRFPTDFCDRTLLLKTLSSCGLNPDVSNGITCRTGDWTMRFAPGPDDQYYVEITHCRDLEQAYSRLAMLDTEYRRVTQESTYNTLMTRIREKGLTIESEEVQEDNSVVITLLARE